MKLSRLKSILPMVDAINFELPNGELVPSHYHVTEVGSVAKNFIDCGGTIRIERAVSFQLWTADDVDHRLQPEKLLHIISLAEKQLNLSNDEIEVEYQSESTINKFGLDFNGKNFVLTPKVTACLAEDECMPSSKERKGLNSESKPKVNIAELLTVGNNGCTPGSGCC